MGRLGINDNPLVTSPGGLMSYKLDLTWVASAPAKVISTT
jgi:hypothetical protein